MASTAALSGTQPGARNDTSTIGAIARMGRRTGLPVCSNAVVRGECLDEVVWTEVCRLLQNPARVEAEYRRRREESPTGTRTGMRAELPTQSERVNRSMARLIDSYAEG